MHHKSNRLIKLKFQKQEEQQTDCSTPSDVPGELVITMVTRAVSAIVQRLNSLANFEGTDSKVGILHLCV